MSAVCIGIAQPEPLYGVTDNFGSLSLRTGTASLTETPHQTLGESTLKAFVVNNPRHEKFVDLILRLTNASWTKKTQMFSATYLVMADPPTFVDERRIHLEDIDVETKALRLLEKTKASVIRVCNHCGFQWMQTYETDAELDEMFKNHTAQQNFKNPEQHKYPDWTTHRNFNVKLVFDVGLEFPTKNTPEAEETVNNFHRKLRSWKKYQHHILQDKKKLSIEEIRQRNIARQKRREN